MLKRDMLRASKNRARYRAWLALGAIAVLLVVPVRYGYADYADGVRTEQAMTLPDAVKVWRQDAWQRDDFLAEVRLGDLYSTNQSINPGESKNGAFFDPVEAYVWYFLALRPGHNVRVDDNAGAYDTIYAVRGNAENNAEQIYSTLTFEQRLDARARLLYILSSRGADGFLTLGRVHSSGWYGSNNTAQKPVVMLCMRSSWDHWYSAWLWWLWSGLTGKPYPHPPVWKWVGNTADNWQQRLPDYQCSGAEIPPEPSNNYPQNAPAGGYPQSASVPGSITVSGTSGDPGQASNAPSSQSVTVSSGAAPGYADSTGASGFGGGNSSGSYPSGGFGNGGYGYRSLPSVFETSDAEALTYFQIAGFLGHPLAGPYAANARSAIKYYSPDAGRIIADAEKRARFWTAPYEYYPGITAKGKLHSDEALPTLDGRLALKRVREIPFPAVVDALAFRGYQIGARNCGLPPVCFGRAVQQFQAALDFEPTGVLSPEQTVRLIQMAAVDGDANAQDRLGIMYSKGIGVPQNFVRAEKWFIKAANQRHPDALFNLSVLYRVGPNGVEPDEAKAGSFAAQAVQAGYLQARCELQELIRMADGNHDRDGRDHDGHDRDRPDHNGPDRNGPDRNNTDRNGPRR